MEKFRNGLDVIIDILVLSQISERGTESDVSEHVEREVLSQGSKIDRLILRKLASDQGREVENASIDISLQGGNVFTGVLSHWRYYDHHCSGIKEK